MTREPLRRLVWAAIAYTAWIVSYEAVGWYARTLPAHDLSLSIDHAIPLQPGWVWIYELTYVLPFVAVFLVETRERFERALLAIFVAAASAYPMYLLVPVAFEHPVLGHSLSEQVVALEYQYDFPPGANHLPSLHVANALILFRAVNSPRLGRLGNAFALALCLAIAASTLLVKQHIVVDVLSGFAWGAGAWWLAPKLRPVRKLVAV